MVALVSKFSILWPHTNESNQSLLPEILFWTRVRSTPAGGEKKREPVVSECSSLKGRHFIRKSTINGTSVDLSVNSMPS